jgi:hypothetical protein
MLTRRDLLQLAGGSPILSSVFRANLLSAPVPEGVTFTDVTAQAGLSHALNVSGSSSAKKYLLEEMGGGVALFDYDNDGWLDIFLVNGTSFDPSRTSKSYLFRNNRDGTFTDVSSKAGLNHCGWGQGCCVGDYDNDGWDDLFVSYWGRNVLYHNNGDGTFTDVSEKAGIAGAGQRWGAGCCFLDFDRDGRLDLFVANYVQFDPKRVPLPGSSLYCRYSEIGVPCGPQGLPGGTNILYRNRGDGTFEDVSERSGVANPRGVPLEKFVSQGWRPTGSYGMGVAAADFDNDGWPDIYVACDTAPSLLYHNNKDGTFSEIAVSAGCAFDENGVALSGMGVAVGDYNNDGWLDLVRTNFTDQVTTVYQNNGDGSFSDVSLRAGLGINTKYLGFGVGLFDYDNDGWKDLFITNGHVYSQLATRKLHLTYKQPGLLYRNGGNGRFEDVSGRVGPDLRTARVGRGCAFGDLDNDGDIDIVVNTLDGPPAVLRNDGGNRNNWLLMKCVGTKSNRSAIGARISITAGDRVQMGEVMSGGSYYSHNDLRLHFGLGSSTKVDLIKIAWPSGLQDTVEGVAANQIIAIEEGKGLVTLRTSKTRP